jgi:NADPH-dependent 7-cyano-7-deazaguanine reductase QueF
MTSYAVEIICNKHGFERFRVKIVKRFNIPSNIIMPELSHRPSIGEIKCIYVGRGVNEAAVKEYLVSYFREKGMLERIVKMQLAK